MAAAITAVQLSSMVNGPTTGFSQSFTTPGAGQTMFMIASSAVSGNNCINASYGGSALTQIGTAINGTQRGTTLWYLHNPSNGANTLSGNFNTNSNRFDFGVAWFSGLDTGAGPSATSQNTGSGTSCTGTVTVPGGAAQFVVMINFNMYNASTNSTKGQVGADIWATGNDASGFYNLAGGPGSFSMTQTSSSAPWGYIIASFAIAGAGGGAISDARRFLV